MLIGAMNHPAQDPVLEIEWIGQHGFDFVDLTLEPPGADPADVDRDAIRQALDRHGLGVIGHTGFLAFASPLEGIRQAALDYFLRCLEVAAAVGASILNTHYAKPSGLFSVDEKIGWHLDVLSPLCEEAAKANVTIVVEHVPDGGADQLENIVRILDELPQLGFHLDSGHARLEGDHDRYDQYLSRLGDRLVHVHFSDNDGRADQHLPLGAVSKDGTNWRERVRALKAIGYDRTITLEVYSHEREYLLLSRDLLKRWWEAL